MVIGCNFCPFASRPFTQESIRYFVEERASLATALQRFMQECVRLDEDAAIETTFIIFPEAFLLFDDYLHMVDLCEKLLKQEGYEGTYQVATFHPGYCFAGVREDDASNFTNRSLYPMLHLLREHSIEAALSHYSDPGAIPERNINFAREKGSAYMKMLRDACL